MKANRILIILTTAFLFTASGNCFAGRIDKRVTKDRAKELGLELRTKPDGAQLSVELEFKPQGNFKDFSHVMLEIKDGDKTLLGQAILREAHADSWNFIYSFHVDPSFLDKAVLTVATVENDLQGHYEIANHTVRVKDFVEPEKSPILSPEVSAKDETPKDVEAARLRGAATAAKDIKAGTLRILYSGIEVSEHMDENTGYRLQHIGSGCMASAAFSAEVEAYNQAMQDWHAKNPTQSKK